MSSVETYPDANKVFDRALVIEWVQSLESGKYRQTTTYLRTSNGYCCLGVVCNIIDPNGWQTPEHHTDTDDYGDVIGEFDVIPWRSEAHTGKGTLEALLNDKIAGKLGLSVSGEPYGQDYFKVDGDEWDSLVTANDNDEDFNAIAETLREYYELTDDECPRREPEITNE